MRSKNCERCAKRCRAAQQRNNDADLFVKGTVQTGRFCADCLVADFFKNCERGPLSGMGQEFADRFDPESLRLPHIQDCFRSIIATAKTQFGAELTFEEIDWDEVRLMLETGSTFTFASLGERGTSLRGTK